LLSWDRVDMIQDSDDARQEGIYWVEDSSVTRGVGFRGMSVGVVVLVARPGVSGGGGVMARMVVVVRVFLVPLATVLTLGMRRMVRGRGGGGRFVLLSRALTAAATTPAAGELGHLLGPFLVSCRGVQLPFHALLRM